MSKEKLFRKLKKFLTFQKKETKKKSRKAGDCGDLFMYISPAFYDYLVRQLTCDELSELLENMSTDQIRRFLDGLSNEEFHSRILECLSDIDLDFAIISDERMIRFFDVRNATPKDFENLFFKLPTHISEKIRLFELFNQTQPDGIGQWLMSIFWLDTQTDKQKDFFKFVEELVENSSCVNSMNFIFERVTLSVDSHLLRKMILADEKGTFTTKILQRLDGTEKFLGIFKKIDNTDNWLTIIEKTGYKNFAKLKGKTDIIEVFKNNIDDLYNLFCKFIENFWLFFTLEDVTCIYRVFTKEIDTKYQGYSRDEVIYEDIKDAILLGINQYTEKEEPYLEFYSLLSYQERLGTLKRMAEMDKTFEKAKHVLKSQEKLDLYEELFLKYLESEEVID